MIYHLIRTNYFLYHNCTSFLNKFKAMNYFIKQNDIDLIFIANLQGN